jgi:hypothetical protein
MPVRDAPAATGGLLLLALSRVESQQGAVRVTTTTPRRNFFLHIPKIESWDPIHEALNHSHQALCATLCAACKCIRPDL